MLRIVLIVTYSAILFPLGGWTGLDKELMYCLSGLTKHLPNFPPTVRQAQEAKEALKALKEPKAAKWEPSEQAH